MTKRSIAVALALLLAALAFPLAPPPAMANPSIQQWYLTDFTSGVSGAHYRMIRGSGNGGTDTFNIAKSTSMVWAAAVSSASDEASNIVIDMSGDWSVTIVITSTDPPNSTFTVDIGVVAGGSFISKGTSAEQSVPKTGGTFTPTVTTTNHTINPGEYLGVRVNAGSKAVDLDVLGATNSPCYVTSPDVPDYPGTVTISFTVTDTAPAGLQFGTMNPGDDDKREADNDVRAVQLTVGAETNVNCSIEIKGDDFAITLVGGTADSGSPTTMVDSGADFSGVSVNDILINETDGSAATLTGVDDGTDTLTFSGGLSGGSDNTFQTGDAYSVREGSPAYTIDIGNAKWDTDSDVTGATAMTGTYAQITTSTAGSLTEQDVWHWLSVPSGQVAGDYTGMFYYQAIQQ